MKPNLEAVISVRCSKADRREFRRAAKRCGYTLSTFVAIAARNAARAVLFEPVDSQLMQNLMGQIGNHALGARAEGVPATAAGEKAVGDSYEADVTRAGLASDERMNSRG